MGEVSQSGHLHDPAQYPLSPDNVSTDALPSLRICARVTETISKHAGWLELLDRRGQFG
jgi:hypothetical protein